jgi:hypothetical protein
MELYTLDSLLRREQVVDRYESLIWTERFAAFGDFELLLHSTLENRTMFKTGTKLALNESYRVMTVETIEDKTNADGVSLMTVKGRSLEAILEDRVAKKTLSDLTVEPQWGITGTVGAITDAIFRCTCTNVTTEYLDPADVIPFYVQGTIFPADTIALPTEQITVWLDPETVYKTIKDLCDLYDIGFRLVRNFDTSQLYFNIYAGSDRTTSQTTLSPVVFSPDLDNLQNTTELTSIETYKNVAYVFSPVGFEIVYPLGIDPTIDGFERHVLLVHATDIEEGDPVVASAMMVRRGLDELSKNRQYSAFDGELNQNSAYKYGLHYNLGDLIEMRNVDGLTNKMQVTEQIFVSDKEGERSYPTLAINQFIEPGSWLAWDYNQVWEDLGPTEYWADA